MAGVPTHSQQTQNADEWEFNRDARSCQGTVSARSRTLGCDDTGNATVAMLALTSNVLSVGELCDLNVVGF